MDGKTVLNILVEAGILHQEVWSVNVVARADGYLSVSADYFVPPETAGAAEELARLRQIAQITAKMVKLQLEDGQVDDRLAEQVSDLING